MPDWLRILPLGEVELSDSREPFEVDAASLAAMVTAFRSRGVDLVIDYEHQSLQGERAPAAGWIKDLEARSDGLWARVEWTRQAREYLLSKEYRYFSPVLRLDPETRKPLALMHLGLTNVPAIKRLPPLVAKLSAAGGSGSTDTKVIIPEQEMRGMMDKIKELLGLNPEMMDDAVAGRMLEVLGNLAEALKLPPEASMAQIMSALAAMQAVDASLRERTAELAALKARLAAEAAEKAVNAALQAGKITPAQKGWALEYFRQDPQGFTTYVAKAPKTVPLGELLSLQDDERSRVSGLAPEELGICRTLNLAPEKYLAAKEQTGGR
ncbi:MAG: phage protease [Deltaproteobacteria bacterium]|nr:phage protease [Deltaproteobacteria bacterium]